MSHRPSPESRAEPDLLVASNRLPVQVERGEDGWRRKSSSGGLVTALEPVLEDRGGVWVGWPGVLEGTLDDGELRDVLRSDGDGYRLEPVMLTPAEQEDFYLGFSNRILWPLCHGLLGRCNFGSRYWEVYRRVNAKFAEAIAQVVGERTEIWIHDYHLMAVAEELRARGIDNPIRFYLHIPFPAPDTFEQLPWADEVLESLLRYDLIGFQTERYRDNFLACLEARPRLQAEISGTTVARNGHAVEVEAVPVSIDVPEFRDGAMTTSVRKLADTLRSQIGTDQVLLGIDRLDYTKGLPQKLAGFERALEKYPSLQGRVSLVQLVVPSREDIPEYQDLKDEIERAVGRINGRFTRGGWVPLLYQFGRWNRERLLAHYRLADVELVTPLRDGMNLVAKEYCVASVDGRGTLILSAFAGAADELGDDALLVNPNDVEELADAIHQAVTMEESEQRRRLSNLQRKVAEHDVHDWVRRCLGRPEGSGDAAYADRAGPSTASTPPTGSRTAVPHIPPRSAPPAVVSKILTRSVPAVPLGSGLPRTHGSVRPAGEA